MVTVTLVEKTSVCKALVHKLLLEPPDIVSLLVTQGANGEVLLLQIGLEEGQMYIFDIKSNNKLIMDGQIWRLLQTPVIVKVMHDGLTALKTLHRKFGICVRSIYDTQVAYHLVMGKQGFPLRRHNLLQLYEIYSDPGRKHMEDLRAWISTNTIDWAQRPMTRHLVENMSTVSRCLFPTLYHRFQDLLSEHGLQMSLYDSSSGQRNITKYVPSILGHY